MSGVFISYRRDDTAGYALSIYDRIAENFGRENVFRDIDSIDPGVNFKAEIADKIEKCKVVLVLIGPRWLVVNNESENPRIFDKDDFVRQEIEAALQRRAIGETEVIPLLVQKAEMPKPDELPESIVDLCECNAFTLTDERFKDDLNLLVPKVKELLGEKIVWSRYANKVLVAIGILFVIQNVLQDVRFNLLSLVLLGVAGALAYDGWQKHRVRKMWTKESKGRIAVAALLMLFACSASANPCCFVPLLLGTAYVVNRFGWVDREDWKFF